MRHFLRDRPALAALLLGAALCLKIFVPVGYMPAAPDTGLIVALCSGATPAGATITIAVPKKPGGQEHGASTADHPCAFAPLCAAMTGADLAPLVLAALVFVFVAAIARTPLALPAPAKRSRPPSHAPPRFT